MRPLPFVILLAAVLLFSCDKNELNQPNSSNLVIKAGFICGWGSGSDSIEISQYSIKYVYYVPAKSEQAQINKTRSVSNSEWIEILSDVNMDDFIKLNYQSCNICFDGCDEWIFIQNESLSHKITFGYGQKIDSISKLQTKLTQLRTEFNVK
jgi:hypothetical protein